MKAKESYLILFLGVDAWHEFAGTFEEAIAYVKCDRCYCNYGRTGAVIVKARKLYQVQESEVETLFV